jgi:biofilm PGA synthesis N-glycosyltransferase PgaC
MSDYAIVTAAHNEEKFIETTIQSVISQSIRPVRWVIVNDGSTDRTSVIVASYCNQNSFMKLLNVERNEGRHFGNKVAAFQRGLTEVGDVDFEFIANLDADISLEPDYFANILNEFNQNPQLGIAGGMVHSCFGSEYLSQNVALDSVAGAVQMFRRACFEQIGGYVSLPHGGIDSAAEIKARTNGWKVQTFPQYRVLEHRRTGSATSRPLRARMKEGRLYYSLGYSPYFHFLRCLYRAKERPIILGSIAELLGYLSAALTKEPVALQPEVVHYLRNEQHGKLKSLLRR